MSEYEAFEYSVCQDCTQYLANDELPEDVDAAFYAERMAYEIGEGNEGHFSMGVDATEDDPEGRGEDEFCTQSCELCNCSAAGARWGFTLFKRKAEV